MTGADLWSLVRWAIGLYLIALGAYSLSTGRMPRITRPVSSAPFPAGREYRGRQAVVFAVICIAAGLLVILARPG
jgi:hypothetical protein